MNGTCTGEHGIGMGKIESLVEEAGINSVQLMREIKLALDPNWILNPDKVLTQ
jgi:D-lactate dehydrogenase (cytochrome)